MTRDTDAWPKMHSGEADIRAGLVERLVAAQFPRYAGLVVRPVRSAGTVNAIYRLGDDLCVRLPRLHQAALIIPYYAETNPEFAAQAVRTVREVVHDAGPLIVASSRAASQAAVRWRNSHEAAAKAAMRMPPQ
ncbi:MAG TPA: hypothetical protein VKG80_06520 [Trebonia sp.]|nr:hypothetical protein [Trebonia sp.]